MGHTATLIGAVALASGLICLLCGFLWGRSNLKSQVEDAVDLVRRSADAREFDLREQLDQKMLEISRMQEISQARARTEGRPRSQKQPEQGELEQINASANTVVAAGESGSTKKRSAAKQESVPVVDATETTIQNLLKSMEEKLKQPEESSPVIAQEIPKPPPPKPPAEKPAPIPQQIPMPAAPPAFSPAPPRAVAQKIATPAPPKLPATQPAVATQANTRPVPAKPPVTNQRPAAKDEWQEFAASLEALRRKS
jgi:hypothetical protein